MTRQIADLLTGALHAYSDRAQLAIATPDAEELILLCRYEFDAENDRVFFQGETEDVTVTGLLLQAEDGTFYTATRIRIGGSAPLEFAFLQAMERLPL